jgi:hypothetical protein
VLLGENGSVGFVTSGAERGHVILQQEFAFGGSVRLMTGEASLFNGIVFEFDLSQRLSHFLVTIEAERIARFEKIELAVGRMRVVAFHAIPIHNDLVGALRGGRDHGSMTVEADFFGVSFQELAMRRGVRIVASGTFPFFQRGVDKTLLELFLKFHMAPQAQFAVPPRLQLVFCEIILRMGEREDEKRQRNAKEYRYFIHCKAPHMAIVLYDNHHTFCRRMADV